MGIGHHKTHRWFSCVIKKKFSETKHNSINNMLLWSKLKLYNCYCYFSTPSYYYFFLSGFSFTGTDDSQDSRGREGTIFYSTLPLPPAHKHSDIYLQLCMWDDYHMFLIALLVFTRLLLNEIYRLIKLPFDWLMMWS